jgi:predicted enzyme related to lactoylglutathione lyase
MADQLIAHIEIPSSNLEETRVFFSKVFGWEFKPFGSGYMLFNNHKGIMVGLRKVEKVNSGDTTVFHINVPDINASLSAAKSNGGSIFKEKTVIPAMGWYALIKDPQGNIIGLYQKH